MITGIDHVHVLTTDVDASLEFWINVLGFRLERRGARVAGAAWPRAQYPAARR
jgi:catechol 2,3-dioxygenase-like lactoylglutathione lyase family enzyme